LLPACKNQDAQDTATAATPERSPEPPAWDPGGTEDSELFACGVQAGDVTAESVWLSVRSTTGSLSLVVVEEDGQGWVEIVRKALELTEGQLQFEVEDLLADTAYRYTFFADDSRRSVVGRFRTSLDATGWRVLNFAAVSCIKKNQPWPSLSAAAALVPDAFLFLGDQIYTSSSNAENYRLEYDECLCTQGMVDATASSSSIATWDDHEVANNYVVADLDEGQYDAARQTFREAFPQRQGPTGDVWRVLRYGKVADVFVLDCRSERLADEGVYLGREQMDWLKAELSASSAVFKLIMNSVPITDFADLLGDAVAEDRWQGFPDARAEILGHIDDQAISGVVWVAGDVHFAMVAAVGIPGSGDPGEHQTEICVGPGGSSPTPVSLFQDQTGQYPVLVGQWNTTLLRLDPGTQELGVTFLGDDGSTLAEMTLQT
jgi:alkaline phosphatase D